MLNSLGVLVKESVVYFSIRSYIYTQHNSEADNK